MKVLFITTGYPTPEMPQYCVFLEQQATAFQTLGHTVDVYLLGDRKVMNDSDYIYHGVRVFYRQLMKKHKKIDVLFPTCLSPEDEYKLNEVIVNRYDIVSFHFGGLECLNSVEKVCEKWGIPLVHHFHGLNVWEDYYDPHHWLTAFHNGTIKTKLYRKITATVNVSNAVKEKYVKRISTVPSYVVYNGVDIDRFPFSENRQFFRNDEINILCVANLIPIKGQKYLIEAAAELQNQNISVKLTFAGRGPDEMVLQKLAADKKVQAEFVGYLPYDEIAKLMKSQDIFCMPSFYEALGCVYLEAMSSGMITIGVKGQGIDELISDGDNGFLVEPQSSASIASAVKRIVNMERTELNKISVSGRATAERFTWYESALALEKVYEKEITRRRN